MEVIVWIIATIVWAVAYAIAEIRRDKLKSKYYDALHKNIDLETKVNALDKECQMYLDEAVEIAEEKNDIAKYANFLVKQYEELYQEKGKLEWQNERLREQVEFFKRELSTQEDEKNAEYKASFEKGQKIYWIDIIQNVVREFTVERVWGECPTANAVGEDGGRSSFSTIEIGDMVFFTHEDAEMQLKSTRKKKLNELRKYYICEEEWASLRELDRKLLEVAEKEK